MKVAPVEKSLKNGSVVELRSPAREDAVERLRYLREIFREFSENLNHPPDRFDSVTPEEQAKGIEESVLDPDRFGIVAWLEGRIVGDLSFRGEKGWARHCGELGMSVAKECQGLGVGRALLEHCSDEAKRFGYLNLILRVRTFNASAIRLYEGMGFEKVGLIKSAAKLPSGFVDEFMYQKLI